jgi:hypothetical protein
MRRQPRPASAETNTLRSKDVVASRFDPLDTDLRVVETSGIVPSNDQLLTLLRAIQ